MPLGARQFPRPRHPHPDGDRHCRGGAGGCLGRLSLVHASVAAIIGVLVWELATMLGAAPNTARGLGAAGGGLLLVAKLLPLGLGLPLLFLTGFAGLALLPRNRSLFLVIATLVMLASFGLITHRDTFGLTWMLWLVLVVAVTDIGGYFAAASSAVRNSGPASARKRPGRARSRAGSVQGLWAGPSWRRRAWAWR
jgi:hypothetical protein